MALDPRQFQLAHALGLAWHSAAGPSEEQKRLILQCLPDSVSEYPQQEEELDVLQRALAACDFLEGIGAADAHWLNDAGRTFPVAVRQFVTCTADQMRAIDLILPDEFVHPLIAFIRDTRSHVATLNYDALLYRPMTNEEILRGYDGDLVDGFQERRGFASENLDRRGAKDFGFYLHLHGTSLYHDEEDGAIRKKSLAAEPNGSATPRHHIVLTHIKHKPAVIAASPVLTEYWHRLDQAIEEAAEILVVGYSGFDVHLNRVIARWPKKPVQVVEWDGAGTQQEREHYWRQCIGRPPSRLHRLPNILTFDGWQN